MPILFALALCTLALLPVRAEQILVPMDTSQRDHLRAYGLAFWTLERGIPVEWLLNYRGGAFLVEAHALIASEAILRGVSTEHISEAQVAQIYAEIDASNMEVVRLEKVPKIAVYTPPNKQPWDDAVTLALEYAQIDYEKIWDDEVLQGALDDYDWLHLHHEDFTGQYGKFYGSYSNQAWYLERQVAYEQMARRLGYAKVSAQKKAVVVKIYEYHGRRWLPLRHVLGHRHL